MYVLADPLHPLPARTPAAPFPFSRTEGKSNMSSGCIRNMPQPLPPVTSCSGTSPEFLRVGGNGKEIASSCHHEIKRGPILPRPILGLRWRRGCTYMV